MQKIESSELWKAWHVETIKTPTMVDRQKTVKGAVLKNLAVHPAVDSNETFTITHVKSGLALTTGYHDIKTAMLGVVMIYYTLDKKADPFRLKTARAITKNETAKAIHAFITAHKKVWNNMELEKSVGVFYADRAECEKLRMGINPDTPKKLLDEYAIPTGEQVAEMLLDGIEM